MPRGPLLSGREWRGRGRKLTRLKFESYPPPLNYSGKRENSRYFLREKGEESVRMQAIQLPSGVSLLIHLFVV